MCVCGVYTCVYVCRVFFTLFSRLLFYTLIFLQIGAFLFVILILTFLAFHPQQFLICFKSNS